MKVHLKMFYAELPKIKIGVGVRDAGWVVRELQTLGHLGGDVGLVFEGLLGPSLLIWESLPQVSQCFFNIDESRVIQTQRSVM